jgi:hypothetical protein
MSGYVYLSRPGDDESEIQDWNASTSLVHWVSRFVADNVADADTAAKIRYYPDEDIGWFPFASFTDEQVRDIVRVIRDLLPAAADATFPPPDEYEVAKGLRELVDLVTRWSESRRL